MAFSEEAFLGGIDRRRRERPVASRGEGVLPALDKANKFLKANTVNMQSFAGRAYPAEEIQKDLRYVGVVEDRIKSRDADKRAQWGNEVDKTTNLARIFEAIILDGASRGEWFGPDVRAFKSAPFDDYKNGVDIIVEFIKRSSAGRYLGLAVDVSFSGDLMKKFERIRREIVAGELAMIKYIGPEGRKGVPRVVVGTDFHTVETLGKLWVSNSDSIKKHAAQLLVLEEITLQLQTFAAFAREVDKAELALHFERELKVIEGIKAQKEALAVTKDIFDDRLLDRMKEALKIFRRSPVNMLV